MEQQQMPEGATVARYREEQIRENFGSPSEFLETMEHGDARKLPEVGDPVEVNIHGELIKGVVTGHSTKDGKPVIDFEYNHVPSERSRVAFKWAWLDQVVSFGAAVDRKLLQTTDRVRLDWHEGTSADNTPFVGLLLTTKAAYDEGDSADAPDLIQFEISVGDKAAAEAVTELFSRVCEAANASDPATKDDAIRAAVAFVDGLNADAYSIRLRGLLDMQLDRKLHEPRNSLVESIGITDLEVVEGAERMARVLLKAWGFEFSGEAVRKSENPRAISAWNVVSAMLEEYNGTDLSSAVDSVDCGVQEVSQPDSVTQGSTPDPLQMLRNALRFNELGKRHESAEAISAAIGVLESK
ncbi:hypothetical protein BLA13014_03402 [Burkholderia aenigmatica]|jgi:hypothetical protein|uniref:Uncharacterized protein n=2 Tax=Burkholderia cepacia complex TaxID=87882 RepID=A0AAP4RB41_9BURK|nr:MULTISPECIES: hypothetical protein [Burkholderia]MDN7570141.1 hypothetical protein [Burkholderia contaminans]VWB74605.1 hypothetical protein BLA13014_03402 [Burkholderia aenigmatica]